MKCLSCNVTLSDEESLLTFEHGEHIDLCLDCLHTTDIKPFLNEQTHDDLEDNLNEQVL